MKIRRLQPNPPVDINDLRFQVNLPEVLPNNILEEIVWHKETEIDRWREKTPLLELRKQASLMTPPKNFLEALMEGKFKPALIAEVKKASPSKGVIREDFNPVEIAISYAKAGASCLSVLTDNKFFQGSFENLALVRQAVDLPLLCKEFVIYPYQIFLARAKGADAILLIAAILSDKDLQYFVKIINGLGMTPLIEVHTLAELDRVLAIEGMFLLGINNRNLEDFSVNLETTCELLSERREKLLERNILVVSESGLHTTEDLRKVRDAGAKAVLIGESLVKQPSPGDAVTALFSPL